MGEIDLNSVRITPEVILPPGIYIQASPEDLMQPPIVLVQMGDALVAVENGSPFTKYGVPVGIGNDFEVGYEHSYQREEYMRAQLAQVEASIKEVGLFEGLPPEEVPEISSLCIDTHDIQAFLENPDAYEFYEFSEPQQSAITAFKVLRDYNETGETLTRAAAYSHVLACDFYTGDALGFFDTNWNYLNVSSSDIMAEVMVAPSFAGTFEDAYTNRMLSTSFEEYAHAFQGTTEFKWLELGQDVYAMTDHALWDLGQEAHAKLLVASNAVSAYMAGDTAQYDSLIAIDTSGVAAMAKSLKISVEETGSIEALDNPDERFKAFMEFFHSEDAMIAYYAPDDYVDTGSEDRLPMEKFVQAFGTLLTDERGENFLEGRLTSMDQLVEAVPITTDMRSWLVEMAPQPKLPVFDFRDLQK